MLALAAELEGHPDNISACLLGGYTIAWTEAAGVRALRLDVASAVRPIAFVPNTQVPTAKARRLLPATVPLPDAAFVAGRAALLTAALTWRPELLLAATEDRLHQQYRAEAMPRSAALLEKLRALGVPTIISGAGPTVLALPDAASVPAALGCAPKGWAVHELEVDLAGAQVLPL